MPTRPIRPVPAKVFRPPPALRAGARIESVGRPRGPRAARGTTRTVLQPWQNPPPAWIAAKNSGGEWAVYWTLTRVLRRRGTGFPEDTLPEGTDFVYQATLLGGRQLAGGIVPDFVMTDGSGIGINVDSIFFHAEQGGTARQALDLVQTALLAAEGITLLHLWETALLVNPIPLVRQALAGIQPPQPI